MQLDNLLRPIWSPWSLLEKGSYQLPRAERSHVSGLNFNIPRMYLNTAAAGQPSKHIASPQLTQLTKAYGPYTEILLW